MQALPLVLAGWRGFNLSFYREYAERLEISMASKVRSIQREIARKAEKEAEATLPSSITLTLGDLVDSGPALGVLCNQPDFPGSLNYRISKVVRLLNEEAKAFDEARKRICEKYGPLIPEENRYDVPADRMAELDAEVGELRATSITLPVSPIPIGMLRDTKGEEVKGLTGAVLVMLYWLITD